MSTPLITRVGLKIKKIARDLTESSEEREWRQIWTQIDSIEGWLYENEGKYLYNAARSLADGTNIVEIGSFKGRSTCCLAAGCRGSQKRVFAIDAFDGGVDLPNVNTLPDFSRNLRECGVSSYVEPVVGLSSKVAQTWRKPIHLLFIDGSHAYEDVLADFAGFFPRVVPGGIIAFHDVINETWPGVAKAWAEISAKLTAIGYSDSLGFGRKPDPKAHIAKAVTDQPYTKGFYEPRRNGVMRSSEVIVPLILEAVPARSVVDVGCGDGSWLAVFQRHGVKEILGLDGDYVDREALQIPSESFQACDLRNPLEIKREFDLAVSLEVAEHLPEPCAALFVESLVHLAPAVLFSAAIPFQGGTHHINEQWPDKWAELFKGHGYVAVDMIRKQVWKNETVDWWYAQNTILFVHPRLLEANAALKTEFERTNPDQLSLVHPRKYLELATPPTPAAPSWGVKGAFLILISSLRGAVKRRFSSVSG